MKNKFFKSDRITKFSPSLVGIFFMCMSLVSFSQTTVTKTYTAPSSVTVDGCGTYCTNLPGLTFSAADFSPGVCSVTDVNVSITWAKTDGTCELPGVGSSFHSETNFRIDGPATNVILVQPGTYSGNGSTSTVTTNFDQSAGSIIGGVDPFSGVFQPNNGNLITFNGTSPIGTWTLRAGDTGGGDPLCIVGYSVTVSVNLDFIPPVAICQPYTVTLDAAGNGSLSPADIDGGSFDNCGAVTLSAFPSSFTCADVGPNNVTLTATDAVGLTATCTAVVTVVGSSTTGLDTQVSCGPFTWIDGNTYATSNNTATWTIPNGAASGCDSTVLLDLTIPVINTPINVNATNTTSTSTDITWDAMSLPAGGFFSIQYQVIGSGIWQSGGTVPSGSTMATLTGLSSGVNYEVQVAGNCDLANSGSWSSSAFFSTSSLVCNSPISLAVSNNNGNAVTLSWTVIPATGWYEFRYKESSSATWLFGGTLSGAGTSKVISGLLPNTSYDFEAKTFCPNGVFGAWSPTLTVVTNPLAGCSLPPATVASIITGSGITVTWATVTGASYYAFRYKEASSSTWISGGTSSPAATSKSYTGLIPNTLYDLEARTICANGVSSAWGAIQFTTSALSGCELPPNLNSTAVSTASTIQISWPAVSGAGWYSFQYKASASSTWLNGGTAGTSSTSKTFSGLTAGTSYDFQARTHCSNGVASSWSSTGVYSTGGGPATIATNDKGDDKAQLVYSSKALSSAKHVTKVYPNPTSDKVNIEINLEEKNAHTKIQILDMSGRLVFEGNVSTELGLNSISIDVEELANGLYTLFLFQNEQLLYTTRIKKN